MDTAFHLGHLLPLSHGMGRAGEDMERRLRNRHLDVVGSIIYCIHNRRMVPRRLRHNAAPDAKAANLLVASSIRMDVRTNLTLCSPFDLADQLSPTVPT